MKAGCFLASICFLPGTLVAQPEDATPEEIQVLVQDLVNRHTIVVKGADNPAAIPLGEKLRALFGRLAREHDAADTVEAFEQRVRQRFEATDSDVQILRESARDYRSSQEELRAQNAANDNICPRILDGSVQGGPAIAALFELLDQQRLSRIEAHYRGILDRLSPQARSRALSDLADAAVGSATYGRMDHIGLASEIPDLYETMMISNCRRAGDFNTGMPGIQQGVTE